ncbi:MAG: M17 family peptidase N-terminal domain-containing protein, partial [Candidatus Zixiibacteriota bacterium]
MLLKYSAESIDTITADSLVFFIPQLENISDKNLKQLDKFSSGAVTTLIESKEFTGKNCEMATIYKPENYKAKRIILLGLGDKKELNADSFRKAAGVISRYKGLTSSKKIAFYFGKYE